MTVEIIRLSSHPSIRETRGESVGATVFLKLNEDDEVEQIREIGSYPAFLGQAVRIQLGLRGREAHKVTVRYFTQPEEVNNTWRDEAADWT